MSKVARRLPGAKSFPELISRVSFTFCHEPSSISRNSWQPGASASAKQKTVLGP